MTQVARKSKSRVPTGFDLSRAPGPLATGPHMAAGSVVAAHLLSSDPYCLPKAFFLDSITPIYQDFTIRIGADSWGSYLLIAPLEEGLTRHKPPPLINY